jgi:squalene-hopene/tetraprenyl-beta-curcumene cyclase
MRASGGFRSTDIIRCQIGWAVFLVLSGLVIPTNWQAAVARVRAEEPRESTSSVERDSQAASENGQTETRQVDRRQWEELVRKGSDYLIAKGQAEDGSFSAEAGPGVTALVLTSLLRSGRPPEDPAVARGLEYLKSFRHDDGGIYRPGSLYGNYETCLAILCFSEANRDGRYRELIGRADAYVKGIQWDESEGIDASDLRYGGAGYGTHARPDLSNTTFLIDALRAAGNPEDDPAIQAALVFVSRCQNLESEHNTSPFPVKNPDGGFYYTVAAGGQSQAGETPTGGLRSYGSMTYAGLKSMIYAGVGPDDPRVKAAFEWARKHYDLRANPGLGSAGLFYYYHTFAKALDAMDLDVITDSAGKEHAWRAELVAELARLQQPDGSWLNDNPRWMEGDSNLVSAYTLMALSYCKPD